MTCSLATPLFLCYHPLDEHQEDDFGDGPGRDLPACG